MRGAGAGETCLFLFKQKQNQKVTLKVESVYKRELNATFFL